MTQEARPHKPNCCFSFRTILGKLFCCSTCKKRHEDRLNSTKSYDSDVIGESEEVPSAGLEVVVPIEKEDDGFKILTYNVQVLIGHLSNEKLTHIIESITQVEKQTDVVCLQEVFVEEGRYILIGALSPMYPYYIAKSNDDKFLIEDSGLMIFSKYPIRKYNFYPYRDSLGVDKLSEKGFVVAEIKVGAKHIRIANTHMQSDAWVAQSPAPKGRVKTQNEEELKKRVDVRYSQLRHIAAISTNIVVGDFNINHNTLEYKRIAGVLNKVDTFATIANKGRPITYMKNVDYPNGLKLDYIYTKSNIKVLQRQVYQFEVNGLYPSDHFAVWTRLKL